MVCVLACAGCKSPTPGAGAGPRESAAEAVVVSDDQLAHVDVEPVKLDVRGTVFLTTGRVAYNDDALARVAAPVSGRIESIAARIGDDVKRGQTLAVIQSPQVASAAADLAQDRARRLHDEQSLARAQRLFQSGAGSAREVEEATAALQQAKAAEERDVAALRVLGGVQNAGEPNYVLRSPIQGTVTERRAALGGGVQSDDSTSLFVVADLSSLWVVFDVFEQDVALVTRGASVDVTVPAYPGRTFQGTVDHVAATLDPTTRTAKVRVGMANADRALLPEMFARVTVRSPSIPVVAVDPQSVVLRGAKAFVYVERAPKSFERREVTLGYRSEGRVQLRSGLHEGERIAVRGALLLDARASGDQP